MRHKTLFMKGFEVVFDLSYLIGGAVLFIIQILNFRTLSGLIASLMTMILIFGDSFHLIPRIAMIISGKKPVRALGFGKLVTSITMTVFYVLFWFWGLIIFELSIMHISTYAVIILAVIRIVLCLLPQNHWLYENPPTQIGIIRNIPFALLGLFVILLFFMHRLAMPSFSFLWLAVLLSFIFYIPVVLFSDKSPKWGMLMFPKTCMYIWIIVLLLQSP